MSTDSEDLLTFDGALDRIERILRGEVIAPVIVAGTIPQYYGVDTAGEVCDRWLGMWDRMVPANPGDEAFYQAGAIGWASR